MSNGIDLMQLSNLIFYFMISLGFFVGIVLMAAPEVYAPLNKALQKEYGLKTRLAPQIEAPNDIIDKVIQKNMVFAGVLISTSAFMLMIVFK
jgi:hypothetical protein